tara:strand:+ start:703 stop:954 length:252 start_codon:yes stop_codon:yes gene_type:complete
MDHDCCEECSYWEDRAEINVANEIKMKYVKIEEDKIIAIPKFNNTHKTISGTHKTNRIVDKVNKRGLIKAIIRKSRGWLNLPQ